jgi:hypothetical protein
VTSAGDGADVSRAGNVTRPAWSQKALADLSRPTLASGVPRRDDPTDLLRHPVDGRGFDLVAESGRERGDAGRATEGSGNRRRQHHACRECIPFF